MDLAGENMSAAGLLLRKTSVRLFDAFSNWNRELMLERDDDLTKIITPLRTAYDDTRSIMAAVSSFELPEWKGLFDNCAMILKEINTLVIQPWDDAFNSNPPTYIKLSHDWKQTNPLLDLLDDLNDWDEARKEQWLKASNQIVSDYRGPLITVPQIFIASSSEGLKVANAIHSVINEEQSDWELFLWKDDNFFRNGEATLEALEFRMSTCQFGIYVMTADDQLSIREEKKRVPRGNVICEYGMGVGFHGRRRSFIVHPEITKPTDLEGITTKPYKPSAPPQKVGKFGKRRTVHQPPTDDELTRLSSDIISDILNEIASSAEDWKC